MDINKLFNIDGKIALITGGSRGIGEMIAAGFLANGVKVYITARKEAPLIEKAKELSEKFNGECIAIPCDLSNMEGIQKLVSDYLDHEDSLDILVNNAGVHGASHMKISLRRVGTRLWIQMLKACFF